jgi:hypothetical protein
VELKSLPIENNLIKEWEAYSLLSNGIGTWNPLLESSQIKVGRYMTSFTLSRDMKGYRG